MNFDLSTFHAITGGFKTVPDDLDASNRGAGSCSSKIPFLLWCQFHHRNHGFEKDAGEFSLSDFIMGCGTRVSRRHGSATSAATTSPTA